MQRTFRYSPSWFKGALLSCCGLAACGGGDNGLGGTPPEPSGIQIVDAFPKLSFSKPLYLTHAPGDSGRVFVVTQDGVIYVFDNDPNVAAATVFLDISSRVTNDGDEQGLLGLAFDPDYASNGFLYVNYNPNFDTTGANLRRTHISRFHVASKPDGADPDSEIVLLHYPQPFSNHKGGWLDFGPDGKLYISAGDGGSAGDPDNNAQNLLSLLGKILRINPDGGIPVDNPFANQSARGGPIWAYGLRNPYRASFDRASGNLWAADVGQNAWEEIDRIVKGGNYGWRKFEGNHVFNATDADPGNAIAPEFEYGHDNDRCSITGGYVYRGSALNGFDGVYFYADFCSGELWGLTSEDGDVTSTPLGDVPGQPSSFGEDADGEIYITSFDGHIYKLVPAD